MLKTIKEKSREDLLKENEDLYNRLQQLRGELESYRQAYWRLVKKIESLQIETVLKGDKNND
jgi:uncharacterized protein (DUF3084 family)|tara:strand:- start:17 stop:202 length:186 start_codon:yes stop_codon:yes gene_type:complete